MTEYKNPAPVEEALYDVIEVSLDDPEDVRVVAESKSLDNAEAIIAMAVMRRGVESSYFTMRPHEAEREEQRR